MYKKFTLIELLIMIVIIGILSSIVIPNVSNVKNSAWKSQYSANINNLQIASDTYAMYNKSKPAEIQPEKGIPQQIDIAKLYPDYIKNKIKNNNMFYWIDYNGIVYGSSVKPPEIKDEEYMISWEVEEDVSYNLYEENEQEYLVLKTKNVVPPFYNEDGGYYYISSVDKNGFETPPVNDRYDRNADTFESKIDVVDNISYTRKETHTYQDWIVKKELDDMVFQNQDFPKNIGECSEYITVITDEILSSIEGYIPEEKNLYRLRFTLEREQATGPIYMDFMDSVTNKRIKIVDTRTPKDPDEGSLLYEPFNTYWYGFSYDNKTKITTDLAFDFGENDNAYNMWNYEYDPEDIKFKLCRINNQPHGYVLRNIVVEKTVGEIFYSWKKPVFYKDYGYITVENNTLFIDIDEFRSFFNSGDAISLELQLAGVDTTTFKWFSNRGYDVCIENTSDTTLKTCNMFSDILGLNFTGVAEERMDYTSFYIKYFAFAYMDRGLNELGEKYIKVNISGLDRPLKVELYVYNYKGIER